jgi:multidrug resistance protein MdtO
METAVEVMAPLHRPNWLAWLRRELAPSPGRAAMTLRIVVAVAIVTVISMALHTPETGLSAFMVLFVTKENRVVTTLTAILLVLAATVGIGASIYIYHFTFDYPQLRIPVIALMVFTGMYLSRVFAIGPLGFAVGFVLAITQNMGEIAPATDLLVRGLLWIWVSLVFPITVTAIVNQILLPANPWTALTRGLTQRLDAASSVLQRVMDEGVAGGKRNARLLEIATRGSVPLLADLKFAEMKESLLKDRHASLTATIIASERLINAAAMLEMRTPQALSESDRLCSKALLSEIASLRKVVSEQNPVLPLNNLPVPALFELREFRPALASFHHSLVEETPASEAPSPKKEKKSLFIKDAFTNLAHARFALKVTLAAMACYFLYTGLDWSGIHTAFITCCFIALESTGASMRKGWLRLTGCAIGGLLGFLSIMYLVPHMESIVSLVLLVSAVTAVAGWVAAGSERIAYAGLQLGFAFYFCTFQGFAPGHDFDTIRDRLVGIVLGILVTTAIFHYIWPESAMSQLKTTLACALRSLARFLLIPGIGASIETERKAAVDLRGKLTKDLDGALRLSELALFEGSETDGPPKLSPSSLQAIAEQAQAACLIGTALSTETELAEWQRLGQPAQEAETALRASVAKKLEGIATFIESGQHSEAGDFESALVNWNRVVAPAEGNDRARLLRSLVEQIRQPA